MTQRWDPTIHIDEALATRVIAEQFPDLSHLPIQYLGHGWDSSVFKIGDEIVFRFPRREFGLQCIQDEIACMPHIGPMLPHPVSYPILMGEASEAFPHPFAGYHFLTGQPIYEIEDIDWTQTNLIEDLARFLKALHSLPIDSIPAEIPTDEIIQRMDFENRLPRTTEWLDDLQRLNLIEDPRPYIALFESLKPAFPVTERVIVHGDFYCRHVLINNQRLSGVIDWGDLHINTPAIDLSILYSLFPIEAHERFWVIYGKVEERIKQQALFRAIYSNATLALYAHDQHDKPLLKASIEGLERTLALNI